MKKIITIVLAGFAAASLCASAAELTDQDRAELRQRAQEFQNERARNPEFQPGEGRAAPPAAAPHERKPKKHAAHKTQKKKTMGEKAAAKARSVKNIPGAFVRK